MAGDIGDSVGKVSTAKSLSMRRQAALSERLSIQTNTSKKSSFPVNSQAIFRSAQVVLALASGVETFLA
jgi:hypothetical protein